MHTRTAAAALIVGCALVLSPHPARAQTPQPGPDEEQVEVIMSPAEGAGHRPLRRFLQAIKARIAGVTGRILPMTRCEKWKVRKKDLAAVKREADRRGIVITQLGADWRQLMRFTDDIEALDEKQKAMIERAKASKATMGVKLMVAPPPAVLEHALTADAAAPPGTKEPAKITVAFSNNDTITIVRTSIDIKPDMVIWRGTIEGTEDQVTLMWWASGKMTGSVQGQGRPKSIRHLGGRLYAVVEMGEDRMPMEHAPLADRNRDRGDPSLRDDPLVQQGDASSLRPKPAAAPAPQSAAETPVPAPVAPGKEVVIDVIVAYTAKAASHYSDAKAELVDLSIEEANHSFRRSNLGNVRLRLVHAYQTNYVEEGAHFDHVWRFADKGDGYMDEIHGLRDKYKADVAVLIVDDAQGCGLATRVFADADEAFAVVHHECAATTYTVAHEIGHLIGARHDLSLDKVMTPFPYGHGFVNGTKWRDIMSYREACGGCPRLPVWSSPLVMVKGEPAGTPDLDNRRVIAEQAARVAAFR